MSFHITVYRGKAAKFRFTLTRDDGVAQLDTDDTVRVVIGDGADTLLDVSSGETSPNGSTLTVVNGIPTVNEGTEDDPAQVDLFLDDSEAIEWPVGDLYIELLMTDSSEGDELFLIDSGTVKVKDSTVSSSVVSVLEQAARAPRSVSSDGETVVEHALHDQIEMDEYLANKANGGVRLKLTKLIPGGTT